VILFNKMFGIFGRVAVVFEGVYVLLEPYCEISAGLSHICLCGERHGLAHPCTQGCLSSTHPHLINTQTESRVKWQLRRKAVCGVTRM